MSRAIFLTILAFTACRNDNNNNSKDMAMEDVDQGGGADLLGKMYTTTTLHDIDTNSVIKGSSVKVTGLLVVTPTDRFISKGTQCIYEVWVMDQNCTTPPCGLVVEWKGETVPDKSPTSACTGRSMTPLKSTMIGDVVDIEGDVDTFPDLCQDANKNPIPGCNKSVIQHEVLLDSYTTTSTGVALPSPIAIDLSAGTAPDFRTHFGTAWTMYEGSYVKFTHTGDKLTVSANDGGTAPFHFRTTSPTTTATPIDWGKNFHFTWTTNTDLGFKDNNEPTVGTKYTSIAGIVTNGFGGAVEAVKKDDFVP